MHPLYLRAFERRQLMSKLAHFLQRLLMNRYGQDALNTTLIILSFVFSLLSLIDSFLSPLLSISSFILVSMVLFRFFSKDIFKRRGENQSFLTLTAPLYRNIKVIYLNVTDPRRKYFLCPMCKRMVRIPRKKGRVEITCPTCHHHFNARS